MDKDIDKRLGVYVLIALLFFPLGYIYNEYNTSISKSKVDYVENILINFTPSLDIFESMPGYAVQRLHENITLREIKSEYVHWKPYSRVLLEHMIIEVCGYND